MTVLPLTQENITAVPMNIDTDMSNLTDDSWELLPDSNDELYMPSQSSSSDPRDEDCAKTMERTTTDAEELTAKLALMEAELKATKVAHSQREAELEAQLQETRAEKDRATEALEATRALLEVSHRDVVDKTKRLRQGQADLEWANHKVDEVLAECDALSSSNARLERVSRNQRGFVTRAILKLTESQAVIDRAHAEVGHVEQLEDERNQAQRDARQLADEATIWREHFLSLRERHRANRKELRETKWELDDSEYALSEMTRAKEVLQTKNEKLEARLRDSFVIFMGHRYVKGDEHYFPLGYLPRLTSYYKVKFDRDDASEGDGGEADCEGQDSECEPEEDECAAEELEWDGEECECEVEEYE